MNKNRIILLVIILASALSSCSKIFSRQPKYQLKEYSNYLTTLPLIEINNNCIDSILNSLRQDVECHSIGKDSIPHFFSITISKFHNSDSNKILIFCSLNFEQLRNKNYFAFYYEKDLFVIDFPNNSDSLLFDKFFSLAKMNDSIYFPNYRKSFNFRDIDITGKYYYNLPMIYYIESNCIFTQVEYDLWLKK